MLARFAPVLLATALSAAEFNAARALADLQKAVSFGPRPAGSEASRRMQAWIARELTNAGWAVEQDKFTANTPQGPVAMSNLIARKGGLSGRAVVLTGHTDTKRFPFRFVGANDGGSSTALLLEFARALKDAPLRNDVVIVFFDGEEALKEWTRSDSLYGSRHLAARWAADGTLRQVSALINVDRIGDRDLLLLDEYGSTPALRQMLRASATKLGLGAHVSREPQSIEDDHMPFLEAGVRAIDLIDFDYGPNNAWWHTAQDTPDKCSAESLRITGTIVLEMLRMLEPGAAR
jgi:Zn-dependent M28 family amino/carboxypeptidase